MGQGAAARIRPGDGFPRYSAAPSTQGITSGRGCASSITRLGEPISHGDFAATLPRRGRQSAKPAAENQIHSFHSAGILIMTL